VHHLHTNDGIRVKGGSAVTAPPGETTEQTRHLATYTLEMGSWYATCRSCGLRIADRDRRRAASQFRRHIQEMAEAAALEEDLPEG
jgi:hypothetical protein